MKGPEGRYESAWYSAEGLLNSGLLERGDLLEFKRSLFIQGKHSYSHWAVCIGVPRGINDGVIRVIHLAAVGTGGDFGVAAACKDAGWFQRLMNAFAASGRFSARGLSDVSVNCATLIEVSEGCQVRINNSKDKEEKVYIPEEIVRRAEHQLGAGNYSIFNNNCEHFCRYCRYDNRTSLQVQNAPMIGRYFR